MSDPELSAVSVLFVKLANWPSAFLIITTKHAGLLLPPSALSLLLTQRDRHNLLVLNMKADL
jgi:hypothetical protein